MTSSVDILNSENKVRLIPNPIHSTATIILDSPIESQLEIYAISGKLILRQENIYDGQILNLEHLRAGIYLYKFFDKQNGKATIGKFVKI